MSSSIEAQQHCDRLAGAIQPLREAAALAAWNMEVSGAQEHVEEAERLQSLLMKRLANRDDYAALVRLSSPETAGASFDPDLRRQLTVWRNAFAACQFDEPLIEELSRKGTELVSMYNTFRADLDGRKAADNEIDHILADETDSARVEAAWRASKRIAEFRLDGGAPVAERIRELVHIRNRGARSLGYPNFYRMALELGELDEAWLFGLLDDLERKTAEPFARLKTELDHRLAKKFGLAASELRPWHFGDRFFQTPPKGGVELDLDPVFATRDVVALTVETFDALGLDVRPVVARSSLYPGDPATSKKCQHAFCTTIRAPSDVRILCNVVPDDRWMRTMLHEFGHGIYGSNIAADLPYALRDDAHTLANESIALMMERHRFDRRWLEQVARLSPDEAAEVERTGRRRLAAQHLIFTRWVLVMCHFERALYADPDRPDLDRLWWDLVERFQGLRHPAPEQADPDWAAKIHLAGSPVYYQNYLLGELFGAQLQHAIERTCGPLPLNPEAGRFLVERMFHAGARYRWDDLLERITGERLNSEYFLAAIRAAEGED